MISALRFLITKLWQTAPPPEKTYTLQEIAEQQDLAREQGFIWGRAVQRVEDEDERDPYVPRSNSLAEASEWDEAAAGAGGQGFDANDSDSLPW